MEGPWPGDDKLSLMANNLLVGKNPFYESF